MLKAHPSQRWPWLQAAALCALAAWLPAPSAKADCAHGAHLARETLDQLTTLEGIVFGRVAGDVSDKLTSGSDTPVSPCRSGLCSRPPFVPPAPAGNPVQVDDWCLLSPALPVCCPGSQWAQAKEPALRPIRLPSSIEHPPRFAR